MKPSAEPLFDVVAVDQTTYEVRLLAQRKTLRNAEAVVTMAVGRLGVETDFYTKVPTGKYKDGDRFKS